MLTLTRGLAKELTRNQRRNSTLNSQWLFNINFTRAGIHPEVSKCAFKTHPMKKQLWIFIVRLPWSSPRCWPAMQAENRTGPYPSTLLLSTQFSMFAFPGVQELPLLLNLNTAREKESRILHSSSMFIRGSVGNRGTLSLIRKRPRNTDSEYASALLPRCLELLKVDYMKTRQEQDTGC